jgi:hypothetical protein
MRFTYTFAAVLAVAGTLASCGGTTPARTASNARPTVGHTLRAEQRNVTTVERCARHADDQSKVQVCLSSAGIDPSALSASDATQACLDQAGQNVQAMLACVSARP